MAETTSTSKTASTSKTSGAQRATQDPPVGATPSGAGQPSVQREGYLADGRPVEIPTEDGAIVPTPGDPRTEPVATAAQSWVAGRVGPRTIPEDATATTIATGPDGADEVMPGTVLVETPEGLGRVPVVETVDDPVGENAARIARDLDEGIPLDGEGRRLPDVETRQQRAGGVSR